VPGERGAAPDPYRLRPARDGLVQAAQQPPGAGVEQVLGDHLVQPQPGAPLKVAVVGGMHRLMPYHVGDGVRVDGGVFRGGGEPAHHRVGSHGHRCPPNRCSASVSRV
jgi:hypothetical protein